MSDGFRWNDRQRELFKVFASPAREILIYGGAGGGKTFGIVGAICARALKAPGSRHLIARQRFNHCKSSIGRQTLPEVLQLKYPSVDVNTNLQEGIFTLGTKHGESEIWLGGLDDGDRLDKILGTQFATIYTNEASQIGYNGFTVLKTRLRQKATQIDGRDLAQKFYVDLNPTTSAHWTARRWIDGIDPETQKPIETDHMAVFTMSPLDNSAHLPAEYIMDLQRLPERQRKRFFDGEYQADVEGALWRRSIIQRLTKMPEMRRIVVAIDPAVSTVPGSDETGIIVAGVDDQNRGIVLEDESGRFTPEEWARRAIGLFKSYSADRIVYESNQGGDMVAAVIAAQQPDLPVSAVRATRGKWTRAEPVAALYEREKVFHVGVFDRLEDQMCAFTSDFDRKLQGYSPDRVDALVWAFTELFPGIMAQARPKEVHQYRPPQHHDPNYDPLEAYV